MDAFFRSVQLNMLLSMIALLLTALWNGGVTGNVIYNELIARDSCTYIHVCSFEVVPARSLVECAIKVTYADSEVLFHDTSGGRCFVCHPTPPNVYQLVRGQRFYMRSKLPLCELQVISTWWRHQMETFPRSWPFVRGIHRCPVNSPHKGQWRGAFVFSFICVWINRWVNNREAGDLRR